MQLLAQFLIDVCECRDKISGAKNGGIVVFMQSYSYKDAFFQFMYDSEYYQKLVNHATIFQEEKEN